MNYVRKLGFEESPDYDFMRSLFTKVLADRGEADDLQYDWMALNGGRGWEAGTTGNTPSALLAQAQAYATAGDNTGTTRDMPNTVGSEINRLHGNIMKCMIISQRKATYNKARSSKLSVLLKWSHGDGANASSSNS
jgi:hypothetical protein